MFNFALIGDSLTNRGFKDKNGWSQLIHANYPGANLLNYGYEGYTSAMIQYMIKRLIPNSNIFLATILLGTNDCYSSSFVIPTQYKKNIIYIINHINKLNPDCIILLITPPICKLNNFILEYVNEIYNIKKEYPFIKVVDLHSGNNSILINDLHDGIHFAESGHLKIYNKILNILEEDYGYINFKCVK